MSVVLEDGEGDIFGRRYEPKLNGFEGLLHLFRVIYPRTLGTQVTSEPILPCTVEYLMACAQIRNDGLGRCVGLDCDSDTLYPLLRERVDDERSIVECRCPNCSIGFIVTVANDVLVDFDKTQEEFTSTVLRRLKLLELEKD